MAIPDAPTWRLQHTMEVHQAQAAQLWWTDHRVRAYAAEVLRAIADEANISVYHESGVRMAVGSDELRRRAKQIETGGAR